MTSAIVTVIVLTCLDACSKIQAYIIAIAEAQYHSAVIRAYICMELYDCILSHLYVLLPICTIIHTADNIARKGARGTFS